MFLPTVKVMFDPTISSSETHLAELAKERDLDEIEN